MTRDITSKSIKQTFGEVSRKPFFPEARFFDPGRCMSPAGSGTHLTGKKTKNEEKNKKQNLGKRKKKLADFWQAIFQVFLEAGIDNK